MEQRTPEYAAEMLLVGFKRNWHLSAVATAVVGDAPWEDAHEVAPFLPSNHFLYKAPVRAWMRCAR